ncbi:MAG: glutaminase A [Paracoccus aminovorans]|nr:glutaminase A [Paracoccus aminovorans]
MPKFWKPWPRPPTAARRPAISTSWPASTPGISRCRSALADGSQLSVGDHATPFSIQSISKVFTLAIALGRHGDQLWRRVGREPSSHAFNSAQELESRAGIPANPFVNSGAIVVTDSLLVSGTPRETLAEIVQFVRYAASDDDIFIDGAVAASEKRTGHRNFSLAHLLRAYGNLTQECDETLGTYFHHCAIAMSCAQLARSGRFLAGIQPGGTVIAPTHLRSINALMSTCGHYNGSGEFAFRVGIPAKSGVGGGILAVVPRRASIAVWSPGLDDYGNSKLGLGALQMLSERAKLSMFAVD